jgi:hypothetical protein
MADDGMISFIKEHPTLMIGGGIVAVLLVGAAYFNKQKAGASAGQQDLSGLGTDGAGGRLVYVPTSTNFTTENVGADFSNNPMLESIVTGAITTNSQITKSTASSVVTNNPPVVRDVPPTPPPAVPPPVVQMPTGGTPPVKAPPPPPPPKKGIVWNYPYTIRGGDTLSAIANNITNAARAAGAPSNTVITWQMIYDYNKGTIDRWSNDRGNPIPGGPWNNIFPGEQIWLATWS